MRKQKIVRALLSLFLAVTLFGCKQSPNWQEQVQAIDQEIKELLQATEDRRHQANEQERQAMLYMRSDWDTYSKKIQQVEHNQRLAADLEKRINNLKAKKQKLIEANSHQK